jgi:gamma-butyrobetaine dioxygenase
MKRLDELVRLFASEGARAYLGEPITQAEHMQQAGALAESAGANACLVAAALLHDIGHFRGELRGEDLMDGIDNRHEQAGACYLQRWFGLEVTEPVRLHVTAKRYLCHAEPEYVAALSPASRCTLDVQGGALTRPEARAFENNPFFADAVALRRLDDMAKDPLFKAPPVEHFAPLLEQLLVASSSPRGRDRRGRESSP